MEGDVRKEREGHSFLGRKRRTLMPWKKKKWKKSSKAGTVQLFGVA